MIRRYDLRRSDNFPLTNRVTAVVYGTGTLNIYTGFPVTSAIVAFSTIPTGGDIVNFVRTVATGWMAMDKIDTLTEVGAAWDYVLFNNLTNSAVAGVLRAVTDGSSVEFTDTKTTAIGTVDISLTPKLVGTDLQLQAYTTTSGWTFSFSRLDFSNDITGYSSSSSSSSSVDSSSSSSSSSKDSSSSSSSSSVSSSSTYSESSSSSSSKDSSSSSSSSSVDSSSSSSSISEADPNPNIPVFMKLYVTGYTETGFVVTYENIPEKIGFIDFVYFAV